MDRVIFEDHLALCHPHPELATGLEIYIFSESKKNSYAESTLLDHDIEVFLYQRNRFEKRAHPARGEYSSTMRLTLQKNVDLANTFEPTNLSLPKRIYLMMVEIMNIPHHWIDTSSCVGPFFWSTVTKIEGRSYFQIIYRKSDVKKNGKTRGWELVLSYDINCRITTGFYKGTDSSKMVECLKVLQKCIQDIGHPMLLPVLICSRDLNMEGDLRQREARETVRNLEKTITTAAQVYSDPDVTKEEKIDLGLINRDLVDCHCKVLWKRPEAYLEIVSAMQDALLNLQQLWPDSVREQISAQNSSLEARLKFLKVKLHGLSTYRQVTIARLEMLQGLVRNLVSLSIARSQKKMTIKRIEKQQTHRLEEMKEQDQKARLKKEKELEDYLENWKSISIALVGVIFLPGAFLALSSPYYLPLCSTQTLRQSLKAIFSTSFFDFHAESPKSIISPWFWVYWVITVPITLVVLGLWYIWHRHIKQIKLKRTKEMEEMEIKEMEKIRRERSQPLWTELNRL